jgi:Ca2+:H+ antiporter
MAAKKAQRGGFHSGMLQPLDLLLLAVPAAVAIRYVPGWRNETLLFIVTGLAIIPLAGWMGQSTGHLSARAGPGIGGLLNATFGNAAELIIALMALNKGLIGVVKSSITGSIIGNILLVVGASMLAGGMRFTRQTFNKTAARTAATSLSLAAIGLIVPTIFHISADQRPEGWSPQGERSLSLAIAVVLFVTYILWLVFSLVTHKELFSGPDESGEKEAASWPLSKAVTILAMATMLIAFMSEFLVGSVEAARESLGLTEVFVGVIIVAIIGNAAEHSTAVMYALKNKMDLSLGIAIGSSLQIALFVTPVLIFASYLFDRPMSLEFSLPETASVALAVWLVVEISGDGECNWLEGVQLLSVYFIIGILFYFLPEPVHVQKGRSGGMESGMINQIKRAPGPP